MANKVDKEGPPIKLHPLLGTDDSSHYTTTDDNGVHMDAFECIVPLIYIQKAEPRTWRFVGTAFFIAQNLIATARHVLDEVFDGDCQLYDPYVIQRIGPSSVALRPLISCSPSPCSDIATAQIRSNGQTNKNLPLRESDPIAGEVAFTFAFPNTSIVHDGDNANVVVTEPAFYRGTVIATLPNGRDKVMLPWPCVHVNFFMHPGSSGGPVLDRNGRVFGVNCMSGEPHRNVAYATAIGTLRETALRDVIVDGKHYDICPFDRLLESGVIELH